MNGIYNKTWKDLYVSTKVFATINAISFKQDRKVRDVMLNLYILFAALVWNTLTFKLDNHRCEFPGHFSNRHNFWAISTIFYSPDLILVIKEVVNTSHHSIIPNFYTFVRSTGNQVCVTRTKCNIQHPGCTFNVPAKLACGTSHILAEPSSEAVTRICESRKKSRSEWAHHGLLAYAEVSQLWYQKYWWFTYGSTGQTLPIRTTCNTKNEFSSCVQRILLFPTFHIKNAHFPHMNSYG